jgi:sugar lactone lactonase YvrE
LFKGPNDLDFDAEGNLFFTDPWGTGPGPNLTDQTGAVYLLSRDGMLRKVMDSGLFPNGIAVSPDDTLLAVGDFRGGRIWYSTFQNGPTMGCPQCPKDPSHSTFGSVKAGTFIPGNGGPDGMHYDVRGNLWAALAGLGGIVQINAWTHSRFCAGTERRHRNDQFCLWRPRQSVHLFGGGDQRDLLALQGALSRADRTGGCAPAGATIGLSLPAPVAPAAGAPIY